MGGMKLRDTVDWRIRLVRDVDSIYDSALSYRTTSSWILDKVNQGIFLHPKWDRLPKHAREYIMGYISSRSNEIYRHHLEWRVMLDGNLIRGAEVPDGRWSDVESGAGQFVWKVDPSKHYHVFGE